MNQNNSSIFIPSDYEIYVKPTDLMLTQRKLEGLKKLAEIKQWGIRNPTKFMHQFLGVDLLDAQEYVFMNSWYRPYCLWLESRGSGKSSMIALYFMTKGMLFNNYWGYICSGNADQAQETFRKIEDIAKKNIESMTGLTDVFKNEIVINQANSDGFIRSPMGFTYKLYNGSFVKTLNSNIDGKRGKRGSAVCFDEGSWLTDEIFNVIGAFTAVNKDFKLGGDIDVNALPKEIPNQLIYASSASAMDTAFYKKYRDFSKKMFLGDDRYFVADINCDIVIHATAKGIPLSKSLLTQETVDNEMRNNPEKALREYYNRFTQDGGVNQIIKRALITRNSEKYVPVLYNDTSERKFVLCYDPARNIDNSTVLIAEIIFDEEHGYRLKIVNSVNFTDLNIKKKKKPMRTPDQIKALKQLILDYNGKQALDYDNITLLIDGGSGGGGHLIPDFFMEDWKDKSGKTHKGLIDPEYSSDYVKKYPTAVHKLKVVKPAELKSQMYEALIKMVESDLIIFPEQYDNHGYLVFTNKDDMKIQKIKDELYDQGLNDEEIEEKLFEMNLVQQETYKLSLDEENALSQIDAMKEEVVNMCRVKRDGGKDAFRLPAHKDADTGASEGTLHDDRSYTLAMAGWFLSELRLQNIRNVSRPKIDPKQAFRIRPPKKVTRF